MMIQEPEETVSYPVESPATPASASTPSSSPSSSPSISPAMPEMLVDRPLGLDKAAPKVHHLHVATVDDDFKRSLRFMHGGSSTNAGGDTTGSLAASAKRVALGDGDQRMYRHRASVANTNAHAAEKRSADAPGHSAARSPMCGPRRAGGGGTTIMEPLAVEVMEVAESPMASPSAARDEHRTGGGYASSAASPLGRSRIATAAPEKPRGQRLRNDGEEDEDDAYEAYEEDTDGESPLYAAGRSGTGAQPARKESVTSENATSPVWHRSPRADTSLSVSEKVPVLHRSPRELSLNGPLSAMSRHHYPSADDHRGGGGHALEPTADLDARRESRLSDDAAASPIWHRSPRTDSLDVASVSRHADHHNNHHNSTDGGAGGAGGLYQVLPTDGWLKKVPVLHRSPQDSALGPAYSSTIDHDKGSGAEVEDGGELDADSPVWSRPNPSHRSSAQASELLDLSVQSASKAPIMHSSPASSRRASPPPSGHGASLSGEDCVLSSLNGLPSHHHPTPTTTATVPAIPQPPSRPLKVPVKSKPTTKSAGPRSASSTSSTAAAAAAPATRKPSRAPVAEPLPPVRKPAVPRFPHRRPSQGQNAAVHTGPPRKLSDEEALPRFVEQYMAGAAPSVPSTTTPAWSSELPVGASYPTEAKAEAPIPSAEGPTGPRVGESLLDQILRRSAAALGNTTTANETTSGAGAHRFSSSHNSFLTSNYQRGYELTAADSVHRPSLNAEPSLLRAHTTLTAVSGKSAAGTAQRRQAPVVTVRAETLESLVPVKGHPSLGRSVTGSQTIGFRLGAASTTTRSTPASRRGSASATAPVLPPLKDAAAKSKSKPLAASTTTTPTAHRGEAVPASRVLPPLVAQAAPTQKAPLPAAAKSHVHNADGSPKSSRSAGPDPAMAARYANSPYLTSAVDAQRTARAAALASAPRKTRPKQVKAVRKQKRSPKTGAKPKKRKRVSYSAILNEEDRYGHVLTHHGFWGETAL